MKNKILMVNKARAFIALLMCCIVMSLTQLVHAQPVLAPWAISWNTGSGQSGYCADDIQPVAQPYICDTIFICEGDSICFENWVTNLNYPLDPAGGEYIEWFFTGGSCSGNYTHYDFNGYCCTYPAAGTFYAGSAFFDSFLFQTGVIFPIKVLPAPVASFTLPASQGCLGDTLCMAGSALPVTPIFTNSYSWVVDGITYINCPFGLCNPDICFPSSTPIPDAPFLNVGVHTITYYQTGLCGTDSVTQTYEVLAPDLSFTMNDHCFNTGFTAISSCDNAFVSWSWNFGDPASGAFNTGTGELGFHTFTTPLAQYNVSLTATDIFGNTYIYQSLVLAPAAVNADIAGYGANNCGDTPVSYFAPCDSNVVYSWGVSGGTPTISADGCTAIVDWSTAGGFIVLSAFDTTRDCSNKDTLFIGPCCYVGEDADVFSATNPGGTIYFNNDTTSAILQNPLYIAAGFVSGTTFTATNHIVINGFLIVDTNFRFFLCNEVHPGVNAIIDVMSGVTFTVDSSKLINECDYMWEGIRVSDPTAIANVMRNSRIEYAKNCIHSYNGGRYYVDNSTINNCVRGIVVEEYNLPNPSHIRGSIIEMDLSLSPPFFQAVPPLPSWMQKTMVCVYITKNHEISVGDTTQASYANKFRNVYNGIQVDNSKVYMYQNRFQNISNDPLVPMPTGYGIDVVGVKDPSLPTTTVYIGSPSASVLSRNNFFACTNGIRTTGFCNDRIRGNFFQQVSDVGIDVNANPNLVRISKNTIVAGTTSQNVGIRLTNCTNLSVIVDGNTISGATASANNLSGTGILVQSSNPAAFRSKVRVLHNVVNRSRNGIWMLNLLPIGTDTLFVQYNTVNFNTNWNSSGLPSQPHSGIRIEKCTRLFADTNNVTTAGTTAAIGSEPWIRGFYVENSITCVVDGNIISKMGSGIMAKDMVFATIYPCNDISLCRSGFNFTGSSGAFVFVNQIPIPASTNFAPTGNVFTTNVYDISGLVNPGINWYYGSSLPGIAPSTGINLIQDLTTPTLCGTFYFLPPLSPDAQRRQNVGDLLAGAAEAANGFATYDVNVHSLRWLVEHPDWINLGLKNDDTYENFYSAYVNSSIGTLIHIDELLGEDDGMAASYENAGLIVTNESEYNKQVVNSIYLRSWFLKQYYFSPADAETLLSIALQNPVTGGEAVYDARVMLGIDVDLLEGYSSRAIQEEVGTQKGISFKVYPNPATDDFTIEFSGEQNDVVSYHVITLNGQLVQSGQLIEGEIIQKVSCTHLEQGVYLLSFFVNEELIESRKLVIMRE